jgi:hypothetical protein
MRNLGLLLLTVWLPAFDIDSTSSEVMKPKPGSGLSVSLAKGGSTVVFHNTGPDSVFIVKSLDGSVDCILMPNYRFTIRDPDGQPVKQKRRRCGLCGPWADTRWPQDYLIEIKPGATYSEGIWLDGYYKFEREGRHTISFEYDYEPTEGRLKPPPQAWRGKLRAPEIVMDYKKE